MGVPNFYSWLIRRYPHCLYTFEEGHGHKIDFMYMDMNQVIYKCATDPSVLFKDQLKERNFDEVWVTIFNYINELITLVEPQKVLFIALDGVAPRAKMNQQRQRRFQSAKRYANLNKQLQNLGFISKNETFKNNQISPGTHFMYELNQQIKFFIERKFHEDPRFQHLKVIFSGSDVPGEGEHKILSYVRNLKYTPNFDDNWTHMIYGADADLIMLGLLTQLNNVCIIRENMKFKQEVSAAASRQLKSPEYQIINLRIVREYLDLEYNFLAKQMKIPYDIHRVIDDFILLCFFVGNDFLPRVFCFDIRQGTIEPLVELFKKHLLNAETYIVDRGEIDIKQFCQLLQLLTGFEKLCLEDRQNEMKKYINLNSNAQNEMLPDFQKESALIDMMTQYYGNDYPQGRVNYYENKCGINMSNNQGLAKLADMACNYFEGVQFVLYYYFKGVPSWQWFYRYYYAPLCSDIYLNVQHILNTLEPNEKIFDFQLSKPFPPFKQLLCILSPENASLLPIEYQQLLLSPKSILRFPEDLYPSEFEIDPYGTIYEHQFITKVPFLNEEIIDQAYNSILESQHSERNILGNSILFSFEGNKNQICKSTLPELFEDFFSQSNKQEIDLEKILDIQYGPHSENNLQLQLPSLSIVKIIDTNLLEIDEERKSKLMILNFETKQLDYGQFLQSAILNNFTIYCGYPIQKKYQLLAVMREDQLQLCQELKVQDIDILDGYQKKDHQKYYKKCFVELPNYQKQGLNLKYSDLLIVRKYKYLIRKNNYQIGFPSKRYTDLVFPYEFTLITPQLDFNYQIDEPLKINNSCVVFSEQSVINGSVGKIVKLPENNNNILSVELISFPHKVQYKYISDSNYFSVYFAAEKLECTINVLFYILGSVQVYLDSKKDSMIAESIDIGLNIINRAYNMIVPELVRLPQAKQYAQKADKYYQYEQLELSKECVDILCQYRNQCPTLFQLLQTKSRDALKNLKINSTDLFNTKDSNIDLLKIYIWILQMNSSHYHLLGCSSKVAKLKVIELPQKMQQSSVIQINAGYVLQAQKHFLPPFYRQHPPIFKIGDRVIHLPYPYFLQGTVVGIFDDGGIMVQVLWDKKYIGFTNLGGRYSLLSCSVCKFTDLYNLTQDQYGCLAPVGNEEGWDCYTRVYTPDFKDTAIQSQNSIISQKMDDPFNQLQQLPQQKHQKVIQKVKEPQQQQQQQQQQQDVLQMLQQQLPELVSTDQIIGLNEESLINNNQIDDLKQFMAIVLSQQDTQELSQVEEIKQKNQKQQLEQEDKRQEKPKKVLIKKKVENQ